MVHVPQSILKRAVALRMVFTSANIALCLPLSQAAATAAATVQAGAAPVGDVLETSVGGAGGGGGEVSTSDAVSAETSAPLAIAPGGVVAGVGSGDGGGGDKRGAAGQANEPSGRQEGGAGGVCGGGAGAEGVREVGVGSEKDGGKRGGGGYGGGGMQGYVTVGGVMLFQMHAIPQAPKKVGAWLVCPENGGQGTLEEIKYPQVTITGAVKHEPPLTVTLTLAQETILVPGAGVTVGRWDEELGAWVRDGLDKVNIIIMSLI